jgi:ribosomal protein S18 acetylase RimI-like enzyme
MNCPDASLIRIVEANLSLRADQEAVLAMVDAYSRDAMGDGKPLDPDVRAQLIPGLRRHPTTLIFLAFDGDQPIGVAEAIETKAKELGCCKLTLEVMDKNHQAVRMYQAAGFERYALQEEAGAAIFMSKPLQ